MYKVIVIDDERKACKLIADYINNGDNGFEVTAVFYDAKHALEYILDNDVDVVITDIKMPGMTGIELAQKIKEYNVDTSVIIMSGYSNFEYAKKAIEYGVLHYILKPIDVIELDDVLEKKRRMLDELNELNKEYDSMKLESESYFSRLILGHIVCGDEIKKEFEKLNSSIPFEQMCIAVFKVCLKDVKEFFTECWYYEKERFEILIENVVKQQSSEVHVFPIVSSGNDLYFGIVGTGETVQSIDYEKLNVFLNNTFNFDIKVLNVLFSDNLENVKGDFDLDYNEEFGETFGQEKQDVFDKSIKYLKENYMKNISRDDVAEYLFVSKSFVDKLYKQKLGKTFCEYLFEVRMKKAIVQCILLRNLQTDAE